MRVILMAFYLTVAPASLLSQLRRACLLILLFPVLHVTEYPHGVFPVSQLLSRSLCLQIWPGLRIYSIAASIVFKVPVWRHIMTWTGARPATAKMFKQLLQMGSVALVPGGIAEMFITSPDYEAIKLQGRKGFVRIAVETGTPIVPVYHFGNSLLFRWIAPGWLERWARKLRVAVGYTAGRFGTPLPSK
jgi:2-acylglycerol O-acyltransferase 2